MKLRAVLGALAAAVGVVLAIASCGDGDDSDPAATPAGDGGGSNDSAVDDGGSSSGAPGDTGPPPPFTTWRIQQNPDAGRLGGDDVAFDGENVYVARSSSDNVAGFQGAVDGRSAHDGRLLWRRSDLMARIAARQGRVVAFGKTELHLVHGADGGTLWSTARPQEIGMTDTHVLAANGGSSSDLTVQRLGLGDGASGGSTSLTREPNETLGLGPGTGTGFYVVGSGVGAYYRKWRISRRGAASWDKYYDPFPSQPSFNTIAAADGDDTALYAVGNLQAIADGGVVADESFFAKFDGAQGTEVYHRVRALRTDGGALADPSALAACGDAVYVAGTRTNGAEREGILVRLDAATGSEVWHKTLPKVYRIHVACSAGAVFVSAHTMLVDTLSSSNDVTGLLIEKRSALTGDFDPVHHVELPD